MKIQITANAQNLQFTIDSWIYIYSIFTAEYQIKGNVYRFCSRFQTTNFDGRVDGRGFMRYDVLYSLCQLLKIDRNDG